MKSLREISDNDGSTLAAVEAQIRSNFSVEIEGNADIQQLLMKAVKKAMGRNLIITLKLAGDGAVRYKAVSTSTPSSAGATPGTSNKQVG